MNSQTNWLHTQIQEWTRDGIIDESTANTLRDRHPTAAVESRGFSIVTAIGAIVFGLGVILFFAFNWSEFSKVAKLAIIFIALLSSHAIGFVIGIKRPEHTHLVEGFHLLGTMMFGAGIWLIAQIYHINEHYPTAFLIWGLGALAFAWILPSVSQGVLACVLISVWGLAEVLNFRTLHIFSVLILALGIVPLAWRERSSTLLFLSSLFCTCLLLINIGEHVSSSLPFYAAFVMALIFMAICSMSARTSFARGISVITSIGIIIYGICLFLSTLRSSGNSASSLTTYMGVNTSAAALTVFWLLFLVAAGLWFYTWVSLLQKYRSAPEKTVLPIHSALVILSSVLIAVQATGSFSTDGVLAGYWKIGLLLYNAILIAHCILLIVRGTEILDSKQVALGFIVIAILIFMRFNDLFHSLLLRSLVFLALGATLFVVGHLYSRQKAKLNQQATSKQHSGEVDA